MISLKKKKALKEISKKILKNLKQQKLPIPSPMSPKPKRLQKPTKVYEEYKKYNE